MWINRHAPKTSLLSRNEANFVTISHLPKEMMMSSPTAFTMLQKIFAIKRKILAVNCHVMSPQTLFCHLFRAIRRCLPVINLLLLQALYARPRTQDHWVRSLPVFWHELCESQLARSIRRINLVMREIAKKPDERMVPKFLRKKCLLNPLKKHRR